MTAPVTTSARRLAQLARPFRALLLLWLVYECSKLAFFYLSRRHGLLQGVSVVNLGTLLFGVWLLLLRFAVLFYLPLTVVYRVAKRATAGAHGRHEASTRGRALDQAARRRRS